MADSPEFTAIRCGWLLDGTGAPAIRGGCVLYSGDRILDAGAIAAVPVPDSARLIDLPGHTCLPGLIDAHSHTSIHTLGRPHMQTARAEADIVIDAAYWLRCDLEAGVTSMRTLGDRDFLDIRLREAQRQGKLVIPRLTVAGNLIQSSHVDVAVSRSTCDGPDAIRAAIRASVREGCDWIKFYSTPDSRAANPVLAIFSRAEVDLVFEEARHAGKPVSAHCHGGVAADWCIEHRIDSLEHGFFLTREQMREMAAKGIVLVPTCGVVLLQKENPSPERTRKAVSSYLQTARSEGVTCIPGTDGIHGRLDFEVAMLVGNGWPVREAISCVTAEAARLLRIGDRTGTIAAGRYADLIAVPGELENDVGSLSRVDLVVQDGKLAFDRFGGVATALAAPIERTSRR